MIFAKSSMLLWSKSITTPVSSTGLCHVIFYKLKVEIRSSLTNSTLNSRNKSDLISYPSTVDKSERVLLWTVYTHIWWDLHFFLSSIICEYARLIHHIKRTTSNFFESERLTDRGQRR